MKARTRSLLVSRRVFAVTATPLMLLILAAGLVFVQVLRMRAAAYWVEHTEESIARCADVEARLHEQHATVLMRLSGSSDEQAEFTAAEGVREALRAVQTHVVDNEGQSDQARAVVSSYNVWRKFAARLKPSPRVEEDIEELDQLLEPVLEALSVLVRGERRLRGERSEALRSVTSLTIYGALPVLLVFAVGIGLYSRQQILRLADDFQQAMSGQEDARRSLETQRWVREYQVSLIGATRDEASIPLVGERLLAELVKATGAVVGAFYFHGENGWTRRAAHALAESGEVTFADREGLLGQAVQRKEYTSIQGLPDGYLRATSGTGTGATQELAIVPCHHDNSVLAVVELGFFESPSLRAKALLDVAGESMGVAVAVSRKREIQRRLLEASKRQSAALQSQQEELRLTNEELASQSEALKAAHAQLEERKEELEASNTSLIKQRDALSQTQDALAARAIELQRANRYKTEFLASMSHELRTPLNSCLILSRALADNKSGNLDEEQVAFAETIYGAGEELLELINDLLELSRIEAGAVELNVTEIPLEELLKPVLRITEPLAKERGLQLAVEIPEAGAVVSTDPTRVRQVLKNLLSNACKFTPQGAVTLRATVHEDEVAFSVVDTGIGVAEDKLDSIFEAFRQADGTTSRRFGGTGLGLTISRDLATRLGGTLRVESVLGEGSSFTLTIPRRLDPARAGASPAPAAFVRQASDRPSPTAEALAGIGVADDQSLGPLTREALEARGLASKLRSPNRVVLLIHSNQSECARAMRIARSLDFDCVVADTGREGLELANSMHPSAIVVAENLPDQTGLAVISQLKRMPHTRDIRLHVLRDVPDDNSARGDTAGGANHGGIPDNLLREDMERLLAQAARRPRILVVEDDEVHRETVRMLLADKDVDVETAGTASEALALLRDERFVCVVLDLNLPDGSGAELLRTISMDATYGFPSGIVYTGKSLSAEEEHELRRYSDTIILKGDRSKDRLLDELTIFFHQVDGSANASESKPQLRPRSNATALRDRRVLLVEDDVRNVFALTSVLEQQGVEVIVARNGKEALASLNGTVDLVLMDLMMPEMDGLEATRRIRALTSPGRDVPIIALTAKAMSDDRQACLEAGANDYVTKPIDVDRLLSLMRIWLKPR